MRKAAVLSAAVIGLALPVLAVGAEEKEKRPKSEIGSPRSDAESEVEIRKLYDRFTKGWNQHDVKSMAGLWLVDGDHEEPDGSRAKGAHEVHRLFEQEHATVFKESHLTLNIGSVWFITADVALVEGEYDLANVRDAEGKPIPIRRGHLTSVLIREGGKWQVAASRAMIPVPLVWKKN